MSKNPRDFLLHIQDETKYLMKVSRNLTKEVFLEDETLKRAFSRSLEIIGEAVKQLPGSFCDQYPEIKWRKIAGMKDKLIHHYFGIDYDIVWDVITVEIPYLDTKNKEILKDDQAFNC